MDKALLKRIGKAVLRSILLFFVFALVTSVSRFVFNGELEHMDMLDGVAFPLWLLGLWHVFYMLLIFESTAFAFHRHAAEEKDQSDDGGVAGNINAPEKLLNDNCEKIKRSA